MTHQLDPGVAKRKNRNVAAPHSGRWINIDCCSAMEAGSCDAGRKPFDQVETTESLAKRRCSRVVGMSPMTKGTGDVGRCHPVLSSHQVRMLHALI